jgi:integrase
MSGSGKIRDRVALTARTIDSLKPDSLAPYRIKDTLSRGLSLRVSQSGEKTWDVSYRIKGDSRVRHRSGGRYDDPGASLEEMRTRVNELTGAARKGRDLIAEEEAAREAKARAMTIASLIDLYLARRVTDRLRSAPIVARILRRVLAPLASVSAASVKRRDLLPLLETIAARGHLRSAGLAQTLLGGMFKWALSRDYVDTDPTRGLPTFDQGQPRDRILSSSELHLLWPWLATLPNSIPDALRLQLLTGARIGEISGMVTGEVDQSAWVWTLPAERAKNKKPRLTPLIGSARALIVARIEAADDGVLFPTENGSPHTSASIGGALYDRRDRLPILLFKTHDLRRTVASTMDEVGIGRDAISAIVGHSDADGSRGARTLIRHYLKSDLVARKAKALAIWEAHLGAVVAGEVPVDNVVPIRA